MKKRNKITGQILNFFEAKDYFVGCKDDKVIGFYPSSELNKEWEDYEEPKIYDYITDFGAIHECETGIFLEDEEERKRIGNYFESYEEAEKAVEKLKAWKRLKDNGVRPTFYTVHNCEREFVVHDEMSGEPLYKKDLMLLFGGEE